MDKVLVEVTPGPNGEVPSEEALLAAAKAAGWTDDPRDGRRLLLRDENGKDLGEILNPLPIAPPVGYKPRDPLWERLEAIARQNGADDRPEETLADMLDFDIPDELPELSTVYEFAGMQDEAPAPPPKSLTDEERAAFEVEYEELKEKARALAKRKKLAEDVAAGRREVAPLDEEEGA